MGSGKRNQIHRAKHRLKACFGILFLQEPLFLQNSLDYGTGVLAHDTFALRGAREGIRLFVTFHIADKPSQNECSPVVGA